MSEVKLNALELAGWLEGPFPGAFAPPAAEELRRLHALCDEMGEALKAAQTPLHLYNAYGWPDKAGVRGKVDNALAKWEESK